MINDSSNLNHIVRQNTENMEIVGLKPEQYSIISVSLSICDFSLQNVCVLSLNNSEFISSLEKWEYKNQTRKHAKPY